MSDTPRERHDRFRRESDEFRERFEESMEGLDRLAAGRPASRGGWFQRLCPHPFGWSYNTSRRRRWCRLCALQQRFHESGPVGYR